MNTQNLLEQIAEYAQQSPNTAQQRTCDLLLAEIPHYHWVGFYFMNHEEKMLHLGPYAGAPTDHVKIPFGKGICGQVAESGNTFRVDDVTEQDNYIACSIETKAELVVPIYKGDELIGQIDIDSHTAAPFTDADEEFLTAVCDILF